MSEIKYDEWDTLGYNFVSLGVSKTHCYKGASDLLQA